MGATGPTCNRRGSVWHLFAKSLHVYITMGKCPAAAAAAAKSLQSCPALSDPMDCSPPGSSIHRIFQARVLEWSAIAFSCKCPRCWQRERGPGICAFSMPSSPSFKSQLEVHFHCEALRDPSPLSEQLRECLEAPLRPLKPESTLLVPCILHPSSLFVLLNCAFLKGPDSV